MIVPARVLLVEPLGSDTLGLIQLGGDGGGEITGRFAPETQLVAGATLDVALAASRYHLFDPETGVALRDDGERVESSPQTHRQEER